MPRNNVSLIYGLTGLPVNQAALIHHTGSRSCKTDQLIWIARAAVTSIGSPAGTLDAFNISGPTQQPQKDHGFQSEPRGLKGCSEGGAGTGIRQSLAINRSRGTSATRIGLTRHPRNCVPRDVCDALVPYSRAAKVDEGCHEHNPRH